MLDEIFVELRVSKVVCDGAALRRKRLSLGVSLDEFATLCGYSKSWLSVIERSTRVTSSVFVETVKRVVHELENKNN